MSENNNDNATTEQQLCASAINIMNIHEKNRSPKAQQEIIWKELSGYNGEEAKHGCGKRDWPTYETVLEDMKRADYNTILTCPYDMMPDSYKTLCPHGAIACIKMELFPLPPQATSKGSSNRIQPYTGLLTPGKTWDYGIIRLSSAIKPPNLEKSTLSKTLLHATGDRLKNANIFPAAAIKIFRGKPENEENDDNKDKNNTTTTDFRIPSGNLLFVGSKVGHPEDDYFAHCQCTQATEKMPSIIKPFVRKFWQYSDNPLALGISEFCWYDGDGNPPPSPTDIEESLFSNFPFCVVLHPVYKTKRQTKKDSTENTTSTTESNTNSFDTFLDDVLTIPIDTTLFDIFACPSPKAATDPARLQRIGRIVTTSKFIQSAPNDGIFFKHQKKEEDMELRPNWKDDIKQTVVMDGGKTKGTVGKLAGWKLFEQHIQGGVYVDFEQNETKES